MFIIESIKNFYGEFALFTLNLLSWLCRQQLLLRWACTVCWRSIVLVLSFFLALITLLLLILLFLLLNRIFIFQLFKLQLKLTLYVVKVERLRTCWIFCYFELDLDHLGEYDVDLDERNNPRLITHVL